jgi:hypothetical protein
MRTTVDIDGPVLREVKAVQAAERRSLGRVVSDLLAVALRQRAFAAGQPRQPLRWESKRMGARVDIADRDALYEAMEGREGNP